MITAAVVFAFPLWIAATKGQGPSRSVPLSVREAARALNDVVVVSGQAWWLFILPAIGLVIALLPDRQRPLLGEYSALARIAMWWTFVPFVMNLLVGVVRPNLVRPRYLVPTLAPIAILTAIAILVLARLVARWVTARRPESTSQRPAIAAASVVVVLALVVQGFRCCRRKAGCMPQWTQQATRPVAARPGRGGGRRPQRRDRHLSGHRARSGPRRPAVAGRPRTTHAFLRHRHQRLAGAQHHCAEGCAGG